MASSSDRSPTFQKGILYKLSEPSGYALDYTHVVPVEDFDGQACDCYPAMPNGDVLIEEGYYPVSAANLEEQQGPSSVWAGNQLPDLRALYR